MAVFLTSVFFLIPALAILALWFWFLYCLIDRYS
jgi:hypothetical protein